MEAANQHKAVKLRTIQKNGPVPAEWDRAYGKKLTTRKPESYR